MTKENEIWEILISKPLEKITMNEMIEALSFYFKVDEKEIVRELKTEEELLQFLASVREKLINTLEKEMGEDEENYEYNDEDENKYLNALNGDDEDEDDEDDYTKMQREEENEEMRRKIKKMEEENYERDRKMKKLQDQQNSVCQKCGSSLEKSSWSMTGYSKCRKCKDSYITSGDGI